MYSSQERVALETISHEADLCVVGGGLAGICAAIAAARQGTRVVIVQDRPVFGGNASSEIRMWVCGAHGMNRRETGIIEELELENIFRNPDKVYSLWDSLLWEKVVMEPNITALMNCSVCEAACDDARIRSVTAWQTTTQTWHRVQAALFADCSGDSVLAPLSGAAFRIGREARGEFGESIEPEVADRRTMGMSCLLQVRELDRPVGFRPPPWARYYASVEELPHRDMNPFSTNFWWLELGGEEDSIRDTEDIKRRLLAEAYGVWDLIKNRSGRTDVANLELDFVGFLPGKRESRRYEGDHIITQNDVRAGGPFEDIVAYGGWSMDDHPPGGIHHRGAPTLFHEAPSPWGIPYRSLYSRNIVNLFFAGRNISATHIALSSSRVMRTCAVIGQAAGTAAALCIRHGLSPRELGRSRIGDLQQALMDDDCWLPGRRRAVSEAVRTGTWSADAGDPSALGSGIERPVEKDAADVALAARGAGAPGKTVEWVEHAWIAPVGSSVTLTFARPLALTRVRIVFDSDLNRHYQAMRMRFGYFRKDTPVEVAPVLVKGFRVEFCRPDGDWMPLVEEHENRQRLFRAQVGRVEAVALRLTVVESWGAGSVRVFALDVE